MTENYKFDFVILINEQPDYPLIQSMVRFFSLFKVKVQFDNDEVTGAWIW